MLPGTYPLRSVLFLFGVFLGMGVCAASFVFYSVCRWFFRCSFSFAFAVSFSFPPRRRFAFVSSFPRSPSISTPVSPDRVLTLFSFLFPRSYSFSFPVPRFAFRFSSGYRMAHAYRTPSRRLCVPISASVRASFAYLHLRLLSSHPTLIPHRLSSVTSSAPDTATDFSSSLLPPSTLQLASAYASTANRPCSVANRCSRTR